MSGFGYNVSGFGSFPSRGSGLFAFTSATFTPGSNTGHDGPSLTEARAGLAGTGVSAWKNNTSYFNTSNGIQLWTVPANGTYQVEAWGAQGGDEYNSGRGGSGARMRGNFTFISGEVISILVGQHANLSRNGGGGGTFVYKTATSTYPLIAAGGGGGWGSSGGNASHGTTSTSGNTTYGAGYARGTGGNGGNTATGSGWGGAGSGWLTNGTSGGSYGGQSYAPRNGGTGGNQFVCGGGYGGFGGGGGGGCNGGGGGGGYSGGGCSGGGAGSYNGGTNQSNSTGVKTGNGQVTITKIA
jgi:hypothetical protein